jgi:hypothetical protein
MLEILCDTGVCFVVSLVMVALLHRRPAFISALCDSCCDKGHNKRCTLYLRMTKSKDIPLVTEGGRNSCEYCKWINILNEN